MAEIVLGIGTSHSPVLSMPPELWGEYGLADHRNPELLVPPDGRRMTYAELESHVGGKYASVAVASVFEDQHARGQAAIKSLSSALREARVDTVVIVSDDQDEMFFDDNMPPLAVYWGDTFRVIPRQFPSTAPEALRTAAWGYGDHEFEVPVDSKMAYHMLEYLNENDFDIAHVRYLNEQYGGTIGPAGYLNAPRVTPVRRQGMPHGFSFVVQRIMDGNVLPIVPVFQNTCYPPNQPTPRRCYNFGKAIRAGLESCDSDARIAVVASGGLSHFVVDEELDRTLLGALERKDGEALSNLPRNRLDSATSESRNWITAAGALEHLQFRLLDYLPGYRTAGGTGGGWAFGIWS
jgi:3-O-methylgallate 3,4-dioxygenase